jgi:protein-S-isoprenylcysteine O-methyltransferase Ste14
MAQHMKATKWEFENRAFLFGMVFAISFPLYSLDHQNSAAALAQATADQLHVDGDLIARLLFAAAALLLIVSALIRTWASSYLRAEVVYAAEVKTAALVADGPYRRVRNPLYLANILMAVGMGAMMSRTGFFVAVVAMLVFCYRLILREEAELQASQGEDYEAYRKMAPRLLPSLRARVASSGTPARWSEGFKAEGWYWGFALAVIAFAITLSLKLFFWILGASLGLFWISSFLLQKKPQSEVTGSSKR